MVVYPEYCGGCVTRNFQTIRNEKKDDRFNVHFDTTDRFILEAAKLNGIKYYHVDNHEIRSKFGDYANIVLFSKGMEPKELKTNETMEKGKHY